MNFSPLHIVLLLIPPVRELDLVGIVDVFATANGFLPPERQYQLELVTSSAKPNIEGMCGLQFAGARHYSFVTGHVLLSMGSRSDIDKLKESLWSYHAVSRFSEPTLMRPNTAALSRRSAVTCVNMI
jgi:transcriptional regulator GlxA family with amidase domain